MELRQILKMSGNDLYEFEDDDPKLFLIYNYMDTTKRNDFIIMMMDAGYCVTDVPVAEKDKLSEQPPEVAYKHYKKLIRNSAAVVLLVGNETHRDEWVDYELGIAMSERKTIMCVNIKGTSAALPEVLHGKGVRVTDWDAGTIGRVLSEIE